jgi:hypothetical protein
MSTKYKFHDQDKLYFISFAVVNRIDLFIRNEYKDIMIASWKHCQENKGLERLSLQITEFLGIFNPFQFFSRIHYACVSQMHINRRH